MNLRALRVVKIQTNYNLIKKCTHRAERRFDLRWLKTVSSTFQDVDFDVSLLPLVIT